LDFDDSPDEAAFRAEMRAFLAPHAPRQALRYRGGHDLAATLAGQRAWQRTLFDAGWAVPAWPREYGGRGLTAGQRQIWSEELRRIGRADSMLGGGLHMLGPTLIQHGSEAQKTRFLGPTARGDIVWCQLFSEPGAGSDLASLATHAVRDGDDWVVTGQKVWSSFANHADMGFLLARTDPSLPKHAGIGFFLVDMRAPGVEVRPLIEMTGGNHFNEVFLSGVRVPGENLVGGPGAGWALARTTLMHERLSIGSFSALEPFARVADAVRDRGGADPVTADELAQLYVRARALDLLSARVRTQLARGRDAGPAALVLKNAMGDLWLAAADLGMRTLGADALAASSAFEHDFLFAPSMHIGGGTEEVVKGVAAEQGLGLPREPDASKGVPFEKLPRSGGAR
jgi:alkylation response protein AidB-like acyl-CoA dehydrogenase